MGIKLSEKQQQAVAEAIVGLKKCRELDDVEIGHANADDILCGLLNQLGLQAVAEEYDKVEKWYS